jgi:hypothetical protein
VKRSRVDKKKPFQKTERLFKLIQFHSSYLCVFSSDTVNFFLPFALRDANTLRPFADAILSRKPCLFFLFFTDGWNVRNAISLYNLCPPTANY